MPILENKQERESKKRAKARTQADARADSRWCCPDCGTKSVQVSYPTWYYENTGFELVPIEPDNESDPFYWYCEGCGGTGSGSPDLVSEVVPELPHGRSL